MNVWTLKTVQDRCKEDGVCWIWQQCLSSQGLPMATIEGKSGRLVGRFVYTRLMGGSATRRFAVVAKCRNRLCVSPDCLVKRSLVQIQKEIWKRDQAAGRPVPAKLDLAKARQIRARRGERSYVLAAEFGVTPNTISRIWRGVTWMEQKAPANASVFTWAQKEAA